MIKYWHAILAYIFLNIFDVFCFFIVPEETV